VAKVALFAAILATAWGRGAKDVVVSARLVGSALFWAGVMLALTGAIPLGRQLSPFPAPTAGSRLRTGGIFALVRHPIYGGVILIFVGIALRSGSAVSLLLSLALVQFLWFKSTSEERLLTERFPDYDGYRQRVTRRFIPWVL